MARPKKTKSQRAGNTQGFRPAPDVRVILKKLEERNYNKSRVINECIRLKWKNALGKRIASLLEAA